MSERASPTDLYRETLASLQADDLIAPVEQLRRLTFRLIDWLPEGVDGEQMENGFPLLRGQLEECLAVAQPLLDFGDERGVGEVCWMLQTLAADQTDSSRLLVEPMSSLALHDLSWTLLADCLARDHLEPLQRLADTGVSDAYGGVTTSVFEASGIRHSNAYERGADRTYLGWRDWLIASDLVAGMTHLGRGPHLAAPLAEAELIAALCFALEHGDRSFCASLGEGLGERRLRAHFRRSEGFTVFARLFGVEGVKLTDRMNGLYAELVGPDRFGPHAALIAT